MSLLDDDDEIPPGVRRHDHLTSYWADRIARARSDTARVRLLYEFADVGDPGMTADEAASATGMLGGCYWKRVSELRLGGLIEPTGDTRTGIRGARQMVCRITTDGVDALTRRSQK